MYVDGAHQEHGELAALLLARWAPQHGAHTGCCWQDTAPLQRCKVAHTPHTTPTDCLLGSSRAATPRRHEERSLFLPWFEIGRLPRHPRPLTTTPTTHEQHTTRVHAPGWAYGCLALALPPEAGLIVHTGPAQPLTLRHSLDAVAALVGREEGGMGRGQDRPAHSLVITPTSLVPTSTHTPACSHHTHPAKCKVQAPHRHKPQCTPSNHQPSMP